MNDILKSLGREIQEWVSRKGPDKGEYVRFNQLMVKINQLKTAGQIEPDHIVLLQKEFGESMTSTKTLQGMVCVKPHGYPGDFEILDKIYTDHISPEPDFEKWDRFFQSRAAPKAVRNRKEYFKQLLGGENGPVEVLSIVGGSNRDVLEYLMETKASGTLFDCLEFDLNAIAYSKKLFEANGFNTKTVSYLYNNIFKFESKKMYDLIWSGGLFDYLDDRTFVQLLKKLMRNLKKDGELVLGNFHSSNPSKDYMEFGEWHLHYRDENKLLEIAKKAVSSPSQIEIEIEEEGVNMFLHVRK